MSNDVSKILDLVASQLQQVVKSRVVVGLPVSDGKRTVVPLSEASLVFGGVGASRASQLDENGLRGEAGVSGGAVKVRPLCALVIEGDEVRIEAIAR